MMEKLRRQREDLVGGEEKRRGEILDLSPRKGCAATSA